MKATDHRPAVGASIPASFVTLQAIKALAQKWDDRSLDTHRKGGNK